MPDDKYITPIESERRLLQCVVVPHDCWVLFSVVGLRAALDHSGACRVFSHPAFGSAHSEDASLYHFLCEYVPTCMRECAVTIVPRQSTLSLICGIRAYRHASPILHCHPLTTPLVVHCGRLPPTPHPRTPPPPHPHRCTLTSWTPLRLRPSCVRWSFSTTWEPSMTRGSSQRYAGHGTTVPSTAAGTECCC